MNRFLFALVIACLLGTVSAQASDWQTEVNTRPGKRPLPRPLTAEYDFGWSGLKAADATAHFTQKKGQACLELSARTTGLARSLWRMDTKGMSLVNARSLRPVKLTQTEIYSRKSVDTIVDFTPKGPRRVRTVKPADDIPDKPKTFKVANAHDLHSALLFVRSQRLKEGDNIRMCVFPGSSPYLADVTVGEREKVKAAGKEWDAIACDIKLREIEKDLSLLPHTKFKRAKVWLSDDTDRLLLRIEADVYVGSIFAEMREVKFEETKPGKRAKG
jgi:hypothetical protein